MKSTVRHVLALLLLGVAAVQAIEYKLDQKFSEQCGGMYSKKAWGGSEEPFILVKFVKTQEEGTAPKKVGLVIWEWTDYDYIWKPEEGDDRSILCDDRNIQDQLCNATHKGEYILMPETEQKSLNLVRTESIDLRNPNAINYPILKTGFYCVATEGLDSNQEYTAVVLFRNAFGELQAANIPKLPFYGGMAILYAVVGIFWGFLYAQNRHDILAVQNYITAIIVFLVVEMLMTWGFYDYENRHGRNVGSKVLMTIVSVLNAGRSSFSFFLLLIVCMGYGVVKPSLGKTMIWVRWLAVAHFVFGVVYSIVGLTVQAEDTGPIILLIILPLSATLTAFYIWTLNSLSATMKDLIDRKQNVKALMYKRLWWCILGSILVIFAFFFFNSLSFAGAGSPDFAPTHWQSRWFVFDGWLNIVYLFDVCFIAYLWRPTVNNRRFAMSDELAQDDDGFEIASIRDSLDEADVPLDPTYSGSNEHAYDPVRPNVVRNTSGAAAQNSARDISPLPAPKPTKPVQSIRESLDGDTIFAVGEDDKWSDDDDDDMDEAGGSDERKRLTGKDS